MKINVIQSVFTSNCYIIHIDTNVYIIDPCVSVDNIKKYIDQNDKVQGIFITHAHIDHIYYLEEVYNYFKCAVYGSKNSINIINDNKKNCSMLFNLNKKIDVNKIFYCYILDKEVVDGKILCISTPGHSADSMCYIIDNAMFTGDTLFDGNVGRYDLYSSSCDDLVKSIKKIFEYKDMKIYPGHGASSNLALQILRNEFVRDVILNKN